MGKRERTRERLVSVALNLFEQHGYDETTASQIAAAAGVTEMTFFRYFETKDAVLMEDPFDPLIAAAVASQPVDRSAFERVRAAFACAIDALDVDEGEQTRRRIRLVAAHAGLRARISGATQLTHEAIAAALVESGVERMEAEVAAGACLGALTAALLTWGGATDISLAQVLRKALAFITVDPVKEASDAD